ncbi:MAG: biotin attachment protein, partial [Kiritimatiellae bacterium]|nr:biotin attachment protein [Kiritimatiellia bacterium]
CVRLGGFGTSVTPVSQFYAQQAIQNVMFGKFKKFAPGYAKMVLGYFGKTPVPPDPEIVKKASEFMAGSDLNKAYSEPTTKTVLEMNDADPKKGGAVAKKMLEDAGLPITDENIFIAASCKEKGILFLKDPSKAPMGCRFADAAPKAAAGKGVTVTINGKAYGVEIKGDGKAVVNGKPVDFKAEAGVKAAPAAAAAPAGGQEVKAPVPGTVIRVTATNGQKVAKGDEILVMDVMKMETPVAAPCDGTVTVLVNATDKVATGDVLATIG